MKCTIVLASILWLHFCLMTLQQKKKMAFVILSHFLLHLSLYVLQGHTGKKKNILWSTKNTIKIIYIWLTLCICWNVLGCVCNGRVDSNGYGKCLKESKTKFPGSTFCYIDSPMGCSDSHTLTRGFKVSYVSAKACVNKNNILTRIYNQG